MSSHPLACVRMLELGMMAMAVLVSCSPATEKVSTQPPEALPTPSLTPTLTATATSTTTPRPTVTFSPSETPTQLPVVASPAEGKGNVTGLVLWNHQPVAQGAVWLCKTWTEYCRDYKTNTDRNGYFVFHNVSAGVYVLAMNMFGSSWFLFYNYNGVTVSANQTLITDPWSIWKGDLHILFPTYGKAISDPFPTFQWASYPGAAYYRFSLYNKGQMIIGGYRVNGTSFKPSSPLRNCRYRWLVEAYAADGTKLAQSLPGASGSPDAYDYTVFTVFGMTGNC